ncbi:DUF7129 domain-containing putative zinc-binding protein [Halococcus sediminicola]
MGRRGLYECLKCEYRAYSTRDEARIDSCRQCGGGMENISVPAKSWLSGE